jgi:hypothetical protein
MMLVSERINQLDQSLAAALLGDTELAKSRLIRVYGPEPSRPLEELLDAIELSEQGSLDEQALERLYLEHRSILEALLLISQEIDRHRGRAD